MVQRYVVLVVLGIALLAMPAAASAACSGTVTATSWTGGGAADTWTDPANWSAGVPGACSDVTIARPDSNALDITGVPGSGFHIHALAVHPGVRLHNGSLIVETTLDWETDPNDFSNGVGYGLTVEGHTNWHGGGQTFFDTGGTSTTVDLDGGATFSGGRNYIETGGTGMLSLGGAVTVAGDALAVEGDGGATSLVFLPDTLTLTAGDMAEPGHVLLEHIGAGVLGNVSLGQGSELAYDSVPSVLANDGTTLSGPGVVSFTGNSTAVDLPDPLNLADGAALRLTQGVMSAGRIAGTGAFQWQGGHVGGDVRLGSGVTTTLSTSGQKFLDADAAVTNAGTFDLAQDTLAAVGGSPSFINSGTLTGGGAIQAPFTQTSSGTLDIHVGSGGATRFDFGDSAAFGGTLRVRTDAGFMPSGSYTIATHTSRSGDFATLAGVAPGYTLSATATATTLTATGTDPNSGSGPGPGPGPGGDQPGPVQAPPGVGPIVVQPPTFDGQVCNGDTAVTVGDSIVRGCFVTKPGNILEAQHRIEVDGLVLTMPTGAGDRFIIDRNAKEIRREKASTPVDVAGRPATCSGAPQLLGRLAPLVAALPKVIYRLAADTKASIIGQAAMPLFGGLFSLTQSVVQRVKSSPAGEVLLTGQAKLRYFAQVAFNTTLAFSGRARCMLANAASALRTGFAHLLALDFGSIELHPEGDHLSGSAELRMGGFFSANGSFQLGSNYISGQYDVIKKTFHYPTGMTMRRMSGQLQLVNATKLRLLGTFDLSGPYGARTLGLSGLGEYRAENGGWALEVPDATVDLPVLGGLKGHFTFRDTGFFDVGVAAKFGTLHPAEPRFEGSLLGWYAPAAQRFSYEGSGRIPNLGIAASGTLSSTGYAGCGELPVVVLGKRVGVVRAGLGYRWGDILPTVFLAGCDIGPYTATKPTARAAQAGARDITLPKGLPAAALRVTGTGEVPKFTLAGPDGRTLRLAADGPIGDGAARLVESPENNTAYVLIGRPVGGRWTLTPTQGSVASLDIGQGLPAPVVSAKVRRRGGRFELRWSLVPRRGQRVTFVEEGSGVHAPIGTASAARGVRRFTPAEGRAGARRIVAIVEQDGMPRDTQAVASFRAPKASGPPAPRGLRLTRSGTRLRIAWRAQRGVDHYTVAVALRGRPSATYAVRRPTLSLAAVAPRDRGTVRVRAVSKLTLREGRPAGARLRARPGA